MTTYTVDYGGGETGGAGGWSGGGGELRLGLETEQMLRRQPPLPWILATTEEAEVLSGRRRSLELQPEDRQNSGAEDEEVWEGQQAGR